ncbi:hypothetical protein E7Z53_17005 [Kocuria salina]|uniref:hypothetical protein n=1 Tax=Kocuria salina TaxID=1929416 RepID=UPI00159348B6|nr:hypothetical protein [Kocuria salina]NVC25123.1 hypothetical protein [Kocuria salina]
MTDAAAQEQPPLSAIEERDLPRVAVIVTNKGVMDESSANYLKSLGTGVSFFESRGTVRLEYFDFLVCFGEIDIERAKNKPIIIFDEDGFGWNIFTARTSNQGPPTTISVTVGQGAHDFDAVAPEGYPSKIRDLATREFNQKVRKGGEYQVINSNSTDIPIKPFFKERGGKSIAGAIEWGSYNIWYLPPEASLRLQWLKLFFEYWRSKTPDKFTLDEVPDEWLTSSQTAAKQELVNCDRSIEETIRKLEEKRLGLVEALENTMMDRESLESRLLWCQDELLASAVRECLEEFGFVVSDSDEAVKVVGGNKYEDLQVRNPDDSDWVALVECKGYSASNGKITDFRQVTRARTRYEYSIGEVPDRCWYVINNRFSDAPHLRPEPLESNKEDLNDYFAKDGIVTIPSTSLFQLYKAYLAEEISDVEAREKLFSSEARFYYRRGE